MMARRLALFLLFLGSLSTPAWAIQWGAGTGTSYPSAIDTANTRTNVGGGACSSATTTNICAEWLNDWQGAVTAIQTELGTLPKGAYGSVKARLDAAVYNGGALGTPSSGSAANLTSFPTLNQNTTGTAATITGVLVSGNMPKADLLQGSLSCPDLGSTDDYSCSLTPAITAYVTGTHYRFKANTANTGPATLNLNSLGALTIVKAAGGITTGLATNDIRAGQWVDIVYDGTNMQMQSTLGNASSGTGDVVGPASATDNAVVRFDAATGKLLQNSVVTIADTTGDIVTPGTVSTGSGSGVAGRLDLLEGTAAVLVANTVSHYAVTDVPAGGTAYVWGAAASTGYLYATNSAGVMTVTQTNIPVRVWLPAAGCNNATAGSIWDLPTTTPAVAACVTGTNIQKGVLDFADTSDGFSAQITQALPSTWTTTGGLDITLYWTTTATTGNAKWSVSTICTAVNASATDDPAFNTANTVTTAAPGTANRVQTSTITGLTTTSCTDATAMLLHLKVFRDGNDAADTIAATTRFIGAELTYRKSL